MKRKPMFFPMKTDNVPSLNEALDTKEEVIAEAFAVLDETGNPDELDMLVYGEDVSEYHDVVHEDDEEGSEVEAFLGTYVLATGGPGINLFVLDDQASRRILAVKVVATSLSGKVVRPVYSTSAYYRLAERLLEQRGY